MIFTDRADAGRQLGRALAARDDLAGAIVLGLPRGGVIVAREVADRLDAPLDFVAVRKLGAPGNEEYAIGAIAENGARVIDELAMAMLGVTSSELAMVEARERSELARRAAVYCRGDDRVELEGRTAIVVDDGVATGSTAIAACRAVRSRGARRILLAVPVAPPEWRGRLGDVADEYLALQEPAGFAAVGTFYRHFASTSDADVTAALRAR